MSEARDGVLGEVDYLLDAQSLVVPACTLLPKVGLDPIAACYRPGRCSVDITQVWSAIVPLRRATSGRRTLATTVFSARLLAIPSAIDIGVVSHDVPSFTVPSGKVI